MKRIILKVTLTITLLCSLYSMQASATQYSFKHPKEEQEFVTLLKELRCVVCQNQSLHESMAPIAIDIRQEIYKKIYNGQSKKDIVSDLVDRYGAFILYQPPFQGMAILLWVSPGILLIFAFFIIRRNIKW